MKYYTEYRSMKEELEKANSKCVALEEVQFLHLNIRMIKTKSKLIELFVYSRSTKER